MLLSKIDKSSVDCISSAFDIFSYPGTNVGVTQAVVQEYLTHNPITDNPYKFIVPPSPNMADLSETVIISEISAKAVDINTNVARAITDADGVSTVQCPGSSWIMDLKTFFNKSKTFDSNNLYNYKAYYDTALSFSREAKDTHLAITGWHEDNLMPNDPTSAGFRARKNMFTDGKKIQFVTKLDADLFNQDRYFVNNVEIAIDITPCSNEFFFCVPTPVLNTRFEYTIHSLKLRITYPLITEGLSVTMNQALSHKPAIYAIKGTRMRTAHIAGGRNDAHINLFFDTVPDRIVMGMVNNDNYQRNFAGNGFIFEPFHVSEHHIEWNGFKTPHTQIDMDFANEKYALAYHEVNRNLGQAFSNHSNGITMGKFRTFMNIWVWNTTFTGQYNNCFELLKNGITSYHGKYWQGVPGSGVTAVFMAETSSVVTVDGNRIVRRFDEN